MVALAAEPLGLGSCCPLMTCDDDDDDERDEKEKITQNSVRYYIPATWNGSLH